MGCDRFVIMDPNYGMYCQFQWKIRKNYMYLRKTLLNGVMVHSADLLMCSDILIVLIFTSFLIFGPYLYYATLHILYINSCISKRLFLNCILKYLLRICIKVFTPKFHSVFHRTVFINPQSPASLFLWQPILHNPSFHILYIFACYLFITYLLCVLFIVGY